MLPSDVPPLNVPVAKVSVSLPDTKASVSEPTKE